MIAGTVSQLITAAAEELEVVDSGNSLTTAEQTSALDRFNRMMDAANGTPALMFCERLDTLTLTSGKQSYTIGSGGELNVTDRPSKITAANLLLTSTVRKPLRILTPREWEAIRYQQVSSPPSRIYNDNSWSGAQLGKLWFYGIPDQNYQFELYSLQQWAQASSVVSAILYPPGYGDYWLYAFAIRLAPMFGRAVTPDLRESFREAKARVYANNSPSPLLGTEPALMDGAGPTYNWFSGTED